MSQSLSGSSFLNVKKLQMLELYYNFFTNFSEVNEFKKFEMDTDSLLVTLEDKELENCIRSEVIAKCERFLSKNCSDSSTANASGNFIPEMCYDKHKNNEKKEPGPFKGELRCTEMLYLCSKTYGFYAVASKNFKVSSESLNRRALERSSDGLFDNYRRVLVEKSLLLQQFEFYQQTITLSLYMEKRREDSATFILREMYRVIESTLNLSVCIKKLQFLMICFYSNSYLPNYLFKICWNCFYAAWSQKSIRRCHKCSVL